MIIFRSILTLITEILVVIGVIFLIILLEPFTLSIAFFFGLIGFYFTGKFKLKHQCGEKKENFLKERKMMNMQQSFSSIKVDQSFWKRKLF